MPALEVRCEFFAMQTRLSLNTLQQGDCFVNRMGIRGEPAAATQCSCESVFQRPEGAIRGLGPGLWPGGGPARRWDKAKLCRKETEGKLCQQKFWEQWELL